MYFNANSVDPDQTPRFAASDLSLLGLPIFILWEAYHFLICGVFFVSKGNLLTFF